MRRTRQLAILLALFAALGLSSARASMFDNPPPLPGWIHPNSFGAGKDSPQKHGIILSGSAIVRSSPAIGDIDGNTGNGNEVAVGGSDGRLYAYHADGSPLWVRDVLPSACAVPAGDYKLSSSPAIGKITGNGVPYVVVGYGSITQTNCDGGVVAVNGQTGQIAWRFSLRAWQQSQGYPAEALYGVVSSPALADTDGDGKMEIAFGGLDRNVYLLNDDGSVRWYYHAADTVWSSPAFVNIDSTPELELVIGTDISANGQLMPPTTDGGFVYAFRTASLSKKRIEYNTGYIWRTANLGQAIYSSPVIGDVLPGSAGSEIVIGSSCFFPTSVDFRQPGNKAGKWIKILRLSDGAVLTTLTTNACLSSSVALGDIDDDGALEIVATVNSPTIQADARNNTSSVVAWEPATGAQKWSTVPKDANGGYNDGFGADLQSPVIADVDGNGSLEVLVANWWTLHVLNGKTGAPLTNQGGATPVPSLFAWGTLKSTPAVGDINGDGTLDVAIGGCQAFLNSCNTGMLYAWTNLAGSIDSPNGSQGAFSAPWPAWRGGAQHTGALAELALSPTNLTVLLKKGSSRSETIGIGGSGASWSATESDPDNIVQLSSSSGSTPGTLTLTLKAPNSAGTYTATVQVSAPGLGSKTLTVQVISANQVFETNLPAVRR